MAFVQILQTLLRDKNIGKHIVPIVPDESRTFGMEGMFRQLGIWNQLGQLYTPQDADQLMFYKESKDGQVLQEGINEPGAMCDWIAAATSYSTHGVPMIPFYIFYSMFGFQRVGDLAWAAGDMRSRGFLLGGTAGRTTLNGEGLQHEDGHSHIYAATIPNCVSYDPTFGYELAVIIQDGLRRMYAEQQDVYYYLTVMNENYAQPAMPEGAAPEHHQGHVPVQGRRAEAKTKAPRVQLLGSGVILREAIAAADLLQGRLGRRRRHLELPVVHRARARRRGRVALEHAASDRTPRVPHVDGVARRRRKGPVIAATDYVRAFAEQIRAFVPRRYVVLGTDGFGRSDTREKLRRFFEVDRWYITVAALKALADDGTLPAGQGRRGDREIRHRRGEARAVDGLMRRRRRRSRVRRQAFEVAMSTIEVKVPDIGDFTDVPVIEVLVKAGDTVKAEDSLVTLESDKATMDVPAPAAGVDQVRRRQGRRQGQRRPLRS